MIIKLNDKQLEELAKNVNKDITFQLFKINIFKKMALGLIKEEANESN